MRTAVDDSTWFTTPTTSLGSRSDSTWFCSSGAARLDSTW
jgi:hypothetical protein